MLESLLLVFISLLVIVALVLFVPWLRRLIISNQLLKIFRKMLPPISQTEQEALDAGTVWWDGDLFSGKPDWSKLLAYPTPQLSDEERAFLNGPVEQLCDMLDEWRITHELKDLPPEVWQFIKDNGFFGLIIPKQYGGRGFSALAHSEIVMKIGSRSGTAAVTVMVPNSLGPAELLMHYGTDEQKNYYLPRLAQGLEVPCFGLTSPDAGSDAGSIPDYAVVCKGEFDGKQDVLGMRVTWEKRYITLGPVATILGLAFKLYDPDHLLGNQEDLGITLALIPTDTPGLHTGRRHLPLDAAFQNGPNWGEDVFIPMDWIIGGRNGVGQGWRMLMNCLAVGRSISLPATSTGSAKLAARTSGAYSRVRVQFNLPIGYFEGIEEALARIGGNTYMMDAARIMTAGAVDLGEKPSVISAIVKYHLTERARQIINDAMDIHGGKGICIGPRNYLGRTYQHMPVSITVEGANILTRNMIIFGQGAIRCHPYILQEITAAHDTDKKRASKAFDSALVGHVLFSMRNAVKCPVHGLFGKYIKSNVPENSSPETAPYFLQLSRFAVNFAFLADVAMIKLGGALKRKERLSARLGDILSLLYLASATLKRFEDNGRPQADLPLLHWSVQDAIYRIQQAFDELLSNFHGNKVFVWLLRKCIFPLGKPYLPPTDKLGHEVSQLLLEPNKARDRLTAGIYLPARSGEPMSDLEQALECAIESAPLEAKVRNAVKSGKITAQQSEKQITQAYHLNVISVTEADLLHKMRDLRSRVIKVDDFSQDFSYEVPGSTDRTESPPPATSSVAATESTIAATTATALTSSEPEHSDVPGAEDQDEQLATDIERSNVLESGQLSEIASSDLFKDEAPASEQTPENNDTNTQHAASKQEQHSGSADQEEWRQTDESPTEKTGSGQMKQGEGIHTEETKNH
ncbi:acyl-CoA dehydrogenase [Nitrosomonas marina]|uniref:Acyl-coenzyme A dehydrogenase n=1 Tax=Nitrosomonas marina TaxID=917 RepID=A0A1I0D528_9PROT|nr:acyl-CoA dehydrogenase [Nitrosomonas marina]SET26582.1 acyl-CoA dehydrogenase [Nitrosomonas marina]